MLKITATNEKGLDEETVLIGYDNKPTKKGIFVLSLLMIEEILADAFVVYLVVKLIKGIKNGK